MNLTAVETLGTIGGSLIALSLLPQAIYTYKTKSAGDISYFYQAIYIAGTTLVNLYALLLGLWPVYVPCLLEESLIISLTIMKWLYDRDDRNDAQLDSYHSIRWSARSSESMRDLNRSLRMLSESSRDLMASGRSSRSRDIGVDDINKSWRWGRAPPSPSSLPSVKEDKPNNGKAPQKPKMERDDSTLLLGKKQLERDAERWKENRRSSTGQLSKSIAGHFSNFDIESGVLIESGGDEDGIGSTTETTGSRLENIAKAVGSFFHGEAIMEDLGKVNMRKRHSWTL